MTIHDFIEKGWTPSHPNERVQGLVQIREYVIILTDSRIYRAQSDHNNDFMVYLIGHF